MIAARKRPPVSLYRAQFARKFSISTNFKNLSEIEEANKRYKDHIEIRQAPQNRGWGLFALKDYAAGDIVMDANVLSWLEHADSHSIQLNFQRHAVVDLPARFINHCCNEANVGICVENEENIHFLALEDISNQQELLWDYETTEFDVSTPFVCSCGSATCRGTLSGFKSHHADVLHSYDEKYIAPYLLLWARENGIGSIQ